MKYCSNCGKQMEDQNKFCPDCGYPAQNNPTSNASLPDNNFNHQQETSTLATVALVFIIFFPLVGLICGLIGLGTYKNKKYRNQCLVAVIGSILLPLMGWGLYVLIMMILI